MTGGARLRAGVGTAVVLASVVASGSAFAQAGFLSGVVRDEVGEPVTGATIHVTTHAGSLSHLTATTGEDGRFLFVVRQSDRWDFSVEAPGFAPVGWSQRVTPGVKGGMSVEVTLERREDPRLWGVLARVDPQSIRTQLAAAEASLVAGRYDEAIAVYESIRTRIPALSVVGLQLGNAYLQKKDYDKAEDEFTRVLKSGAANAAACYHLGEAKAARGLSDEAAAWYQKSAEADRLWTKPVMKLAVLAQNQGNREAAIGYLKQVVALDPDSAEAARAVAVLERLSRVN